MAESTLRQLLPHYVALVLILTVILTLMRVAFPTVNMWVQIGVAVVLGLAYPPLLRYLGMAPEPWQ